MATGRRVALAEGTCDEDMACPVCMNDLHDPRLLPCGHYFCITCLEKIAKGQGDGFIPCPICRYSMKGQPQELKKMKLIEFQNKVSALISNERSKKAEICSLCDNSNPAAFTCYDCHLYLCESCKQDHGTLEKISGHKVTELAELQNCSFHSSSSANCVCGTCGDFLCVRCVIKHDKTHTIEDVKEAAARTRARLTETCSSSCKELLNKDTEILKSIKDKIKKLQEKRRHVHKDFDDIENSISTLLSTVRAVKKRNDDSFIKELKDLHVLEHDARAFIQTKTDLIQYVTGFIKSASHSEIIRLEKEIPKFADIRSVLSKFYVGIPNTSELRTFTDSIQTLQKYLDLTTEYEPVIMKGFDQSLQTMEVSYTFTTVGGVVQGLAYNPNDDTYVVRSNKAEKLIQVFNTSGKNIRTFSSKRSGMNKSGEIDIDTKRNLYLLPTADGKIVTIDYEGKEQKVFDVTRYRLAGINYCKIPGNKADRYIVSSSHYSGETEEACHSVFIVDPEEGNVLREIISGKSKSFPNSVTSFSPGRDVRIAVGYYCGGGVRVYDIGGNGTNVVKGPNGKELNMIRNVCGVLDQGIIVGESSQNSIIFYRYNRNKGIFEGGKALFRMEDLREKEQGLTELFAMAVDWKARRILVKFLGAAADKIFILEEKCVTT